MLNLIAAAAMTVLFNNSLGEDVYNGQEARGSITITQTTYIWAGYGQGSHDRLTQRMGSVETYGAGVGVDGWGFAEGFFAELGYLDQKFSSKARVAQEVAYHLFTRDFGTPPFADNWSEIEYLHEPEGDIALRVGYGHQFSPRWSGQISYQHFQPSEYWRIYNPAFIVEGAEGGFPYPYWEANRRVDNSSLQIGIKFEF